MFSKNLFLSVFAFLLLLLRWTMSHMLALCILHCYIWTCSLWWICATKWTIVRKTPNWKQVKNFVTYPDAYCMPIGRKLRRIFLLQGIKSLEKATLFLLFSSFFVLCSHAGTCWVFMCGWFRKSKSFRSSFSSHFLFCLLNWFERNDHRKTKENFVLSIQRMSSNCGHEVTAHVNNSKQTNEQEGVPIFQFWDCYDQQVWIGILNRIVEICTIDSNSMKVEPLRAILLNILYANIISNHQWFDYEYSDSFDGLSVREDIHLIQ